MRTAEEATQAMGEFEQVAVLDLRQALDVVRRIESLRSAWCRHHPDIPVFSLGISGFLAHTPEAYLATATKMKPVLQAVLGDLYERVRQVLELRLGAPVVDHPSGAFPGFNLLGGHEYFMTPFASAHFDVQFNNLDWPAQVDTDALVSFTLPVALPEAGGSIDIWPLRQADLAGLDGADAARAVDATPMVSLPHRVGHMVVHDGDILHRIAPAPAITPTDRRYTLQGHIARCGSVNYWYW